MVAQLLRGTEVESWRASFLASADGAGAEKGMYWARGYWFTGLITGDESLIDLYLRFMWLYKETARPKGSFSFRNLRKAIFQTNKLYLETTFSLFPMSVPLLYD